MAAMMKASVSLHEHNVRIPLSKDEHTVDLNVFTSAPCKDPYNVLM